MSGSQRASMEVAVNQCMDVGFSNNTVNLIDSDCTETVNALPTLSNEVASEFEAAWQVLLIALTSNRNFWAPYHRQSLVWAFFKLNEPGIEVDVKAIQVMKCTICHPSNATSSSSSRSVTRQRKGVLQYNPLHGLTSMKNHVMNEHLTEFQRYKASLTVLEESARQKTKKRKAVQPSAITEFFAGQKSYHKGDVQQKHFLEDLVIFIAKGYETLAVVESPWLRRLVMRRDPKVKFPTRKALVHEHIPALLAKTMERYVLPAIASCATASITFDLWMSRAGFDTFALVVNFIDDCWEPRHVTVGLFEAHDTFGVAIAEIVKPLLDEFQLTKKIIAWVKDEGSNLTTLERALQLTVSCDVLDIKQPYAGACFGHVMSKACQYATDDDKVCREMTELSLRSAQTTLQSCITWTKKSGKGGAEWRKACIKAGLPARKLRTPVKTRFASKVILFQETLEYADAINICYATQSLKLQARVPTGVTWAVARTVTETLNLVVKQCVLNQTRGYWLLSDALAAALAISVELRAHVDHVSSMNPPLQHGDFDAELEILRAKMSLEAMLVMKPFLSFTQFFTSEKAHNMIVLMVDPRFKGLECVIAYTGVEKARAIVREYDQKVLIPYLVKVHKLLYPGGIATRVEEPPLSSILFGDAASPEEACEGTLVAEVYLFRRLQIPVEEAASPLAWWKANATRFPNLAYLARQFLGIPGSQIETERIFSVARVLTSLRRCRLGLSNVNGLIMIYKNWPTDARSECELASTNVVEFLNKEHEILDDHEDELEEAGYFEN